MKGYKAILTLGLALVTLSSANARSDIERAIDSSQPQPGGKPPLLQCVPYARAQTGIRIYGDAHTWWDQAKGQYARGTVPKVGAVLAIEPYRNSRLGHVAAVTRIIDSRTILVNHANWSVPGMIERNVTVLDVSPQNDWSEVRVWYGPNGNLGSTHWPVAGFIYNAPPGKGDNAKLARARMKTEAQSERRKGRSSDPIGDIIAGRY